MRQNTGKKDMRRTSWFLVSIFVAIGVFIAITFHVATCVAQEEVTSEAEAFHLQQEQMRAVPDLVTPDSIYTVTELKALYYQNLQIIKLLEEIRDLLKAQQEASPAE